MAKHKVTTKSSKRYTYSSFKRKIDDLRIEPARNLQKRVHDYVETSHFSASLNHWKEINLSSGFTSFADSVEDVVQTLPQIIYHEKRIFNSLISCIDKHEEFSLEALLDLLAQFCHDLGPDFMQFYERSLTSLIKLLEAAVNFESSKVLEWGFNCLAYIFKYLSKILTEDLVPTFNLLFPLLSSSKDYISRFSAEALSFLIRKSKPTALSAFVSFSFTKLRGCNEHTLYVGLLTLFTEASVSTTHALYSKSGLLISTLLEEIISSTSEEVDVTLFCDIWMNISRHASAEAMSPLCEMVIDRLKASNDAENLNGVARIVSVITFSESGKKIADWSGIMTVTVQLLSQGNNKVVSSRTLAFLLAVLIRNCDVRTLTQYHKRLFDYYLAKHSDSFIPFFFSALSLCNEKVLSFNGNKYLQQYFNSNWLRHNEQLALFLLEIEDHPQVDGKIKLSVPDDAVSYMLSSMENTSELQSDEKLLQIYKNTLFLRLVDLGKLGDSKVIIDLIERLLASSKITDEFKKDVIGSLLFLANGSRGSHVNFVTAILRRLDDLKSSLFFVKGFREFLTTLRDTDTLQAFQSHDTAILSLSDNLLLPDRTIRYETLKLFFTILDIQGKPIPQILNDCKNIEDIPLTLQNARDITTRIRSIGSEFAKIEPDKVLGSFIFKHLFGLLTVRFSPIWDGVYEIIPTIYEKDQSLVWMLLLNFLNCPDNCDEPQYYEVPSSDQFSLDSWNTTIPRLRDTLDAFSIKWNQFEAPDSTIVEIMKKRRGDTKVSPQIRNQVLKLILLVPQLAERHSRDIVPFLFNQAEFEEIFSTGEDDAAILSSGANWTEADRNSLLKIVGKFKNIKAIYKSDEVQVRLMTLLGSRSTDVQKIALDGLLAYRDPVLLKYRDNLRNLLDDSLFKDEITGLVTNSQLIEKADETVLMPYVIRILFGRAQTPSTSGIKRGRKHAVISILPSLRENYVTEFFKLGSGKFRHEYFFENGHNIDPAEFTLPNLRRMVGYVTILNLSLDVLGSNFPQVLSKTVRPLLYAIAMSYQASNDQIEAHIEKIVSNLRQQALKCLSNFFQVMGESPELRDSVEDVYDIVMKPRMAKFEAENLQQVSSIMKLIVYWTKNKTMYPFLYYDNYACATALMRVLSNGNTKEDVICTILEAANSVVTAPVADDGYVGLVTHIAATCLQILPTLYQRISNTEHLSVTIDLLLNLVKNGYVQDSETRRYLLSSLTLIIKGNMKGVSKKDLTKVLKILSVLVDENEACWTDIEDLYRAISTLYRNFDEREVREAVNTIFNSFGKHFSNIQKVAQLVSDLNSYSPSRMQEYDYTRILSAFKEFSEQNFREYTEIEWLPIVYTCLFFITDKDELALRTNASHTLCKFVDYINEKDSSESAQAGVAVLEQAILPSVRNGLQKFTDDIQKEYISVLAYVVKNSRYYTGLEDMQSLLFNGDEEANFFVNVNHIQLHRRSRAIKRLREYAHNLTGNSIAHYLMPIIEHYVFSQEDKHRNIGNEALLTVETLSNFLTWNQYKALFRRYVSLLKSKPEQTKEVVSLICHVSVALKNTLCTTRGKMEDKPILRKLPNKIEDVDKFVIDEVVPKLSKTIEIRDSETIVVRLPLAEAVVNLVLGLEHTNTISMLPGILTSICQVLRSRSEEVRDAVRKTLANIGCVLGAEYLPFVVKELISALRRGSHIHVLSFTVHHLLKAMEQVLDHSDLDSSSAMIVRIIMEDLFGTAGEEKDSENYRTTMKEVKINRSYDTAEMLSANISLPSYAILIRPVKTLLMERINMRSQNKLEELLRRYTLGLKHNSEASSPQVLKVCYEIFRQEMKESNGKFNANAPVIDENKEFFLINLNPKGPKVQNERTLINRTLEKFALDLLHAVLFRNKNLLDAVYLDGFIPLLKDSLLSEDEGVLISSLRVLILLVKLDLAEESATVFKNAARRVLNTIKDSPSTSGDLCQIGLKYLSSFIRHSDVMLKDSALSYVLGRILPDLNEPHKQGLAFNFLKALVSKHVKLPEIYDVIDSVREIMVTNHTKEIRDVSRSVYYQFLMDYDQSRGRLEKQFKFMVDNLQYPSQEGRQSVMELINLIVNKANAALISRLASSFFVALADVSVNDDAPKCREMASVLISFLLQKLDAESLEVVNKYITAWLKQVDDISFLGLGLRVYKIYLNGIGPGHNSTLDELAVSRIKSILSEAETAPENEWVLVYTALNVFESYVTMSETVYTKDFKGSWNSIISCLLYPHLWVRQASARLVSDLIDNVDRFEQQFTDLEVQTIASRIMRQLGAPSISEDLASVSVKTLVKIAAHWKKNNTLFIERDKPELEGRIHHTSAIGYMIGRIGAIIRSEDNPAESFMSKKSGIQLLGLLIQVLDDELKGEAEKILLPLFSYLEYDKSYSLSETQKEISSLAQECLQMLESKLSVSDFTRAYANVKQIVLTRRQERRAKRSVLAVTEPEKAARRKLRKHARSREKRKHEKDESGYYQRKNKRKRA